MYKFINYLTKYQKFLKVALFTLFVYGLYKITPYFLMDKPIINHVLPYETMENTLWGGNNQIHLTGLNLKNIIGVYINNIYDSDCIIISSSEEEIILQLPTHYCRETRDLNIQIEVRINSDLTCLSNKATLTVLSDELLEVPTIISTNPTILCYDNNPTQTIALQGSGFSANSVVYIKGLSYPTSYDEGTGNLIVQLPYEDWSSKNALSLQVVQYYNAQPTNIKSEKFYLETNITNQ